MKTNVAETSIECFHDSAAHFESVKEKILKAMRREQEYTRREIAVMCGIDYSCASGRVKELLNSGDLVKCERADRGYKNRSVWLVRLKSAEES
jgi:ribosomal protein S25